MDIKKYLKETLDKPEVLNLLADKEAYFLHALNPTPPYLEYEIINEYGVEYTEGGEDFSEYLTQVDIFSKGNYYEIEKEVKKAMGQAGFNRDTAADLYEGDTGLYHKAIRFSIALPIDK